MQATKERYLLFNIIFIMTAARGLESQIDGTERSKSDHIEFLPGKDPKGSHLSSLGLGAGPALLRPGNCRGF